MNYMPKYWVNEAGYITCKIDFENWARSTPLRYCRNNSIEMYIRVDLRSGKTLSED